jgi:hypothetical protein
MVVLRAALNNRRGPFVLFESYARFNAVSPQLIVTARNRDRQDNYCLKVAPPSTFKTIPLI